ncbi:MAG: hypothetical protein WC760_09370 [Bacteroidia bacterium]|jgi:hypothetical protein
MNKFHLLILSILFVSRAYSQPAQTESQAQSQSLNIRAFGALNGPEAILYGFHTAFDFRKQGRFLAGFGSGIEVQSTDSFKVYSIPVFMNAHLILSGNKSRSFYIFFNPGISLAYTVESPMNPDSVNHPTLVGRKADSPNDFLSNGILIQAGLGYESSSGINIEYFIRSQPSNLLAPYNTRNLYVGISLGYRIK